MEGRDIDYILEVPTWVVPVLVETCPTQEGRPLCGAHVTLRCEESSEVNLLEKGEGGLQKGDSMGKVL